MRILALLIVMMLASTANAQNLRFYNPYWGWWPRNPINQRPIPRFPPRANFYFGGPVYNSRPYRAVQRPNRPQGFPAKQPQIIIDHVPLRGKANVMPK